MIISAALHLFVAAVIVAITGCMEMLPGYRHIEWVDYSSKWVGRRVRLPFMVSSSDPRDKLIKNVYLSKSEREVEFSLAVQGWGRCHYFYRYNSLTGLILGFRYVEAEPGDCRAPV